MTQLSKLIKVFLVIQLGAIGHAYASTLEETVQEKFDFVIKEKRK